MEGSWINSSISLEDKCAIFFIFTETSALTSFVKLKHSILLSKLFWSDGADPMLSVSIRANISLKCWIRIRSDVKYFPCWCFMPWTNFEHGIILKHVPIAPRRFLGNRSVQSCSVAAFIKSKMIFFSNIQPHLHHPHHVCLILPAWKMEMNFHKIYFVLIFC